jgi:universal stress protein A
MIPIQSVLVPVDFSKDSILAAKFAASLAEQYGSKLYVLHVIEGPHPSVKEYLKSFEDFRHEMMEKIREDLGKVIPRPVRQRIRVEEILEMGHPHEVIIDRAKDLGVDVIVIATHGRTGLSHFLLGGVAERVIRHAECPVLVVRNPKDKYVYGWE